jgi:hypothetical protein
VAFSQFPDLMIGSSLNSTGKPTTAVLLIGTITFTSLTLTCDKKISQDQQNTTQANVK